MKLQSIILVLIIIFVQFYICRTLVHAIVCRVVKVLKIPSLGASPLCPVAALRTLLKSSPKGKNLPLFQIQCFGKWVPLTDTRLRKQLSNSIRFLKLQDKNITFHSFRRSGATWAFNSNIPMHHIQSHGTWTSEAVWAYITQDHNASDLVATTFQTTLSYWPTYTWHLGHLVIILCTNIHVTL